MYSLFLKILTYLLVTSLIVNQNSHKVSFNHQQRIPKIKHSWNNIRNTISSSISRISYHHTNNNVRVCILISLKIKNVKKIWEKSSENHRIKKYDFWAGFCWLFHSSLYQDLRLVLQKSFFEGFCWISVNENFKWFCSFFYIFYWWKRFQNINTYFFFLSRFLCRKYDFHSFITSVFQFSISYGRRKNDLDSPLELLETKKNNSLFI